MRWLCLEGFTFRLGAAEHQDNGRWTLSFRVGGQMLPAPVVVPQGDLEGDG